jgi:thioredoxin-dependent peroxiredoxin
MTSGFKVWGSLLIVALSFSQATGNDTVAPAEIKPVALAAGQPLPALESTDDTGQPWKSADHAGCKVLVMYFYPGDFTGGCTRQAQAYRDGLAKIEELGAEVVGVSGDMVETHRLFKETYGLTHSLLADREGELAKLLGIPVKAGGKVRSTGSDRKPLLYTDGKRIDLERPVTLARWTLVVGRDGKIASLRSVVNPVTDTAEVIKLIEALPK